MVWEKFLCGSVEEKKTRREKDHGGLFFSYKAGRGNALKDTLPSVSFLLFE